MFHDRFRDPELCAGGDPLGGLSSEESSMLPEENMARLEGLGGGEEDTLVMGLAVCVVKELGLGVDTKQGGLVEGRTGSSLSISCGVRPKLGPGVCTTSRMSAMSWELVFKCCRRGSRLSWKRM